MSRSGAPRFSIVMPTRDRSDLLAHALTTATAQTHADVEIVVSDNASSDHTREVAHATGDPRVRYVRSDTVLDQPDSWEFAVDHARGEWVTILGDDDGMVPSLLHRADRVIDDRDPRVVAWNEATYTHEAFPPPHLEPGGENVLTIHPMSGEVREQPCGVQLRRFMSRREVPPVPGLVNALFHRSVLDRIRDRVGRLFPAPDPAVAVITAVLALEPSYTVIDLPLGVKGLSGATISIGLFHADREMHQTVNEFDRADLFTRVPLQSRTGANLVAESQLRMKDVLEPELGLYRPDRVAYFVDHRLELEHPKRRGDGGAALGEWDRVLRSEPRSIRSDVRRDLRQRRVRDLVRRTARVLPGARAAYRALRRGDGRQFEVIRGAEHGFGDLAGAARHLENHVLAGSPVVAA